jgi:hypothetical protein
MIPNPFMKDKKKDKDHDKKHLGLNPPKSVELSENYDSVLIDEAIVTVDQKMMMHNAMLTKQPKKRFMTFLRVEKYLEVKVNGVVRVKNVQVRREEPKKDESPKRQEAFEIKKGESKRAEEEAKEAEDKKPQEQSGSKNELSKQEERKNKKELSMLSGNVSVNALKSLQFGIKKDNESNSSKNKSYRSQGRRSGSKESKGSKSRDKKKVKKVRTLDGNGARSASVDQEIRGRNAGGEGESNSGKSVKSILKRKGSLLSDKSQGRKSFKKQVSFSNKKSVVSYNPNRFSTNNQSSNRKLK